MVAAMTKPTHPLLKLAVEIGPLAIFFFANAKFGIFVATGCFMAATAVSLLVSYQLERRLPVMPLIGAGVVLVFGGLTLVLQDELFIKLKPTIVNTLFGIILIGGMLFDRPLLKPLIGAVLPLDHAGWRTLTWRWAGFFLLLAALNEIVWRNFSTDTWVSFKVFGIMPLTVAFSLAQLPLIRRHVLADGRAAD